MEHERSNGVRIEGCENPVGGRIDSLYLAYRDRGRRRIDQLQLEHEVAPTIRPDHRVRGRQRRRDQPRNHGVPAGG